VADADLARELAQRQLATPRKRALPLYLTEWGYRSRTTRVREPQRSRYAREGLALAARTRRVKQVVWYQLAGPPKVTGATWDSGLLGPRGKPRPIFRAVRGWSRSRAKRPLPPIVGP
jgi:hypothetical protein